MQRLQIQALKLSKYYHAKVHLGKDAKYELFWWIENFRLYNGKSFILPPTACAYQQAHQPKGGGPHAKGYQVVDHGHKRNGKVHINILELKAVYLAILAFKKFQIVQRNGQNGQQNS